MLKYIRLPFNRKDVSKIEYVKGDYSKERSLWGIIDSSFKRGDIIYAIIPLEFEGITYYEYTYLWDICFDYVNGKVFLPFYNCDIKRIEGKIQNYKSKEIDLRELSKNFRMTDECGVLKYNLHLDVYDIWNSKEGFKVSQLYICYMRNGNFIKEVIDLKCLGIRQGIQKDDISILFDKYISSQVDLENKSVYYKSSSGVLLSKAEQDLLNMYELKWRNRDLDIGYFYYDMRRYDKSVLVSQFGVRRLNLDRSYKLRKLDFESYLLSHLLEHVYWEAFNIDNFIEGKWFFYKYKEQSISMILKKIWLENY